MPRARFRSTCFVPLIFTFVLPFAIYRRPSSPPLLMLPQGDKVPVSAVLPGGRLPMGVTQFQKRTFAYQVFFAAHRGGEGRY